MAILKEFGHPMAVAARYRGDERSVTFGGRLIGPELFPIYMKVLTVNVVITLIVVAITFLAGGNTIWSGVYGAFVPLAIQFAIVTAIFIVIDRRWVRDPEGWDPRTVSSMGPDVDVSTLEGLAVQLIGKEHTRAVSITTSIVEFAFIAIALAVWLAFGVPESIGFLAPGPGWANLYVPATIVFIASFLTPLVTLFRPTWVRFRAVAHIVVDVAIVAIMVASLAIGSWVVLAGPRDRDRGPSRARRLDQHHRARLARDHDRHQRAVRGTRSCAGSSGCRRPERRRRRRVRPIRGRLVPDRSNAAGKGAIPVNLFGRGRKAETAPDQATTDAQALERYRYMLATAPPEDIERAHAEAFAKLTPDQRRQALDGTQRSTCPPANSAATIRRPSPGPRRAPRSVRPARSSVPGAPAVPASGWAASSSRPSRRASSARRSRSHSSIRTRGPGATRTVGGPGRRHR